MAIMNDFMTKHYHYFFQFTIIMLLIITMIGSCTYLNERAGIPDDHIFEEMVEDVIRQETGLDVDLSPASEE